MKKHENWLAEPCSQTHQLSLTQYTSGQVRQVGEQQDSTKAWKTSYDLTYTKK